MDPSMDWALAQVDERLTPLGRRRTHSRAVGQRAAAIGPTVVGDQASTLVLAATLHDIGYAPNLAVTGFHPLDGARFLRDEGLGEIAILVAHHTGARNEAKLRGIPALEEEFPFEDSLLHRALTYCDLTTNPDGHHTNVSDRVAEIVRRYGDEHVVSKGIRIGLPEFLAIENEIETILNGSPAPSR